MISKVQRNRTSSSASREPRYTELHGCTRDRFRTGASAHDERGELIARLLRSLEPDDGEEAMGDEWEAAWSTELDNRVREIRDGSVELIDGDEAIAKVRAAIDARR